jgi:glycosyltransferase involved in cell wall biosynthesis
MIDTLSGGGAERVAVELIRRLDRTAFDVAACVTRTPGMSARELGDLDAPVHVLGRKSRFDADGFSRLMAVLGQFRPDVLHTHKEGSNTLGRIAGFVSRVPVLLAHEHCLPVESRVQRLADSALARCGSDVFACGGAVGDEVARRKWIPRERIHVIPNGIDVELFDADCAAVPRQTLGLPAGPLVAAISRLDGDKDLPTLLRAVPAVLARVPDANLVIAGDGPLRRDLEQLAVALGIGNRTGFLGHRSDVKQLLRVCDVVALSSRREGLPLVVLEAMAMRKPVVATSVGGVSEAVLDGVTGVLVPPRTPEALASALVRLLQDPQTAVRLGRAGRERVERHYAIGAMVEQVQRVYLTKVAVRRGHSPAALARTGANVGVR